MDSRTEKHKPQQPQQQKSPVKSSETEDEESPSTSLACVRRNLRRSGIPHTNLGSCKSDSGSSPRPISPPSQIKTSTGIQQDMRFWKKILMQWISECKFIEQNYFNIEQTDIDRFFEEMKEIIYPQGNEAEGSRKNLIDFLKQHYRDFEPHLDDENELSSADYVYVYSLLLHFCCIKRAHQHFHAICQKLSNQAQGVIANFFNLLLSCDTLSRDSLRHTIATLAETSLTKSSESPALSSSTYNSSSPSFTTSDSPIRTPKRQGSGHLRTSPSTPKTFLLEEQTRELISLRAQIETDRYEKGLLEVQIKQYEDSIAKIHRDHREVALELQKIKSQLLTQSTEIDSKKPGDDDQVTRRLLKELSTKESELSDLKGEMKLLEEENAMLQEKHKFAQREIRSVMDRVNELDCRVEKLNQLLKEKDATIVGLLETRNELDRHLQEMREERKREKIRDRSVDLNFSFDDLDGSFTRASTTNSSANSNSPESLAASVIDKQLKAIEKENQQLREEYEKLKEYNKDFAQNIYKVLYSYCEVLKALKEEDGEKIDEGLQKLMSKVYGRTLQEIEEVSDEFEVICVFFNKLNDAFLTEREYAKTLKEQNKKLVRCNEDLNEKVCKVQAEIEDLKQKAVSIAVANESMEMEKNAMATQLSETEHALVTIKQQKDDLNNELKELQKEYKTYQKSVQKELQEYKIQTLDVSDNNFQLNEKNRKLQSELIALKLKLESSVKEYEESVKELSENLMKSQEDCAASETKEKMLETRVEELEKTNERLSGEAEETRKHIETITDNLKEKQDMVTQLGSQIIDMKTKNEELNEVLNDLQMKSSAAQELHNIEVGKLKEENATVRNDLLELKLKADRLSVMESDFNSSRDELRKLRSSISDIFDTLQQPLPSHNFVLNCQEVNYKVRHLFERKRNLTEKVKELEFFNKEQAAIVSNLEERLLETKNIYENEMEKTGKLSEELERIRKEHEHCHEKIEELNKRCTECAEQNENLLIQSQQDYENLLKQKQIEYEKGTAELESAVKELEQVIRTTIEERDQKVIQLSNDKKCLMEEHKLEVEDLALQIANKDKELKSMAEKCRRLEEKLHEKESSVKQLKDIVNDLEKLKETLGMQVKSMQREYQKVKEELEEKKKDLEHQISLLKTSEDSVASLKKELDNRNMKIKNQMEENETLVQESEVLRLKLSEAHKEKAIMGETFKEIKQSFEESEREQAEKTAKLENTIADVIRSNHEISALNTKIQTDLVAKEAQLADQIDENRSVKAELSEKILGLTCKLQEASNALDLKNKTLSDIHEMLQKFIEIPEIFQEAFSEQVIVNYFEVLLSSEYDTAYGDLLKRLNRILNMNKGLASELLLTKEQVNVLERNSTVLERLREQLDADVQAKNQEIRKLKEQISNELHNQESKLFSEIKHLYQERDNLEEVNRKISDENSTLQQKLEDFEEAVYKLNEGFSQLKHEKDELNEQLKASEEKAKSAAERWQEVLKQADNGRLHLETHLNEVKQQLAESEQEKLRLESELKELSKNHTDLQEKLEEKQVELEKEQLKVKTFQESLESLEEKLSEKMKENSSLLSLKTELDAALNDSKKDSEKLSEKLQKLTVEKLNLETKILDLTAQLQDISRSMDLLKVQLSSSSTDVDRLQTDIEALKEEKQIICNELKEKEKELTRANDNLTKMIAEVTSIRREKESYIGENQLLLNHLNEISKNHESSESKLKEKVESAQLFERQAHTLRVENESLRDLVNKYKGSEDKLYTDNVKLRENSDNQTKRIEKLALQLGDVQARNLKLERELEKSSKALEAHISSVESQQKEKACLLNENKTLREKTTRLERSEEQLQTQNVLLKKDIASLREAKDKLEQLESENSNKIKKLEKLRQSLEEKLRTNTQSLNTTDVEKNQLTLEVGALNSQINELEHLRREQEQKVCELSKCLQEARQSLELLQSKASQMSLENSQLSEELLALRDHYSKANLALQISEEKTAHHLRELENIRSDLLIVRQEKKQEELSLAALRKEHEEMKLVAELSSVEKANELKNLNNEIYHLKKESAYKDEQIETLKKELDDFYNQPVGPQLEDLEAFRTRLRSVEGEWEKEKEVSAQLKADNEILQAKYRGAKQRLAEEAQASEARIKENRLELEGKLAKMKEKMKSLHSEGINKIKAKHEKDMEMLQAEHEALRTQNLKFEEHTKKLSSQILELNERVLQLQTENTFLLTKLKHLEEKENLSTKSSVSTLPRPSTSNAKAIAQKRPTSMHSNTNSSTSTTTKSLSQAPSSNLVGNLAMEDEEGEVFNNTYLADLKQGRMSDIFHTDINADELRYRNSLLPRNLRCSYAPLYFDQDVGEDELKSQVDSGKDQLSRTFKDMSPTLDNSMSALLTSTDSGQSRKKISGVTHYKRPGPPTPSKNGGRLSFGGHSEPPREILKESNEVENATPAGSTKTPARFGAFLSRFSMGTGTGKDENSPPKRGFTHMFKKK